MTDAVVSLAAQGRAASADPDAHLRRQELAQIGEPRRDGLAGSTAENDSATISTFCVFTASTMSCSGVCMPSWMHSQSESVNIALAIRMPRPWASPGSVVWTASVKRCS